MTPQQPNPKPLKFSWVNVLGLGLPYGIMMSAANTFGFFGLPPRPFHLISFLFCVFGFGIAMEATRYYRIKKAFLRK